MVDRGKPAKHGLLRQSRTDAVLAAEPAPVLPPVFQAWFESRGCAAARASDSPAGEDRRAPLDPADRADRFRQDDGRLSAEPGSAGPRKREGGERSLHTLYVSPLKALAVDVARNLLTPLEQMQLPIRVETRTGDTSTSRKQRQRARPPDIHAHYAGAGRAAAVACRCPALPGRARLRHPR
jgi:ATP-dependent Lhr-like helicase